MVYNGVGMIFCFSLNSKGNWWEWGMSSVRWMFDGVGKVVGGFKCFLWVVD